MPEQPLRTQLSIDGAHAGVGGIDSWGSMALPQHRISLDAPIEWDFVILPFAEGEDSAAPRRRAQALRSRLKPASYS